MSRTRSYCFTDNADLAVPAELPAGLKYMICQIEKAPNTDKLHLQGYVYFINKVGFNACKQMRPAAHWERCKGTPKQNIEYCSKEDTRVDGPYELGERPQQQGQRNDIVEFRDAIKDGLTNKEAIDQYPSMYARYNKFFDKVRLFNKPQRYLTYKLHCVPWDVDYSAIENDDPENEPVYVHPGGKWWDDYDGEDTVIMSQEDFNTYFHAAQPPFRAETKFGFTWVNPKTLLVKKPNNNKKL